MRGYEFELRRSGEVSLGLWRKRFAPRGAALSTQLGQRGEGKPRSGLPRRLVFVPGFGDTPLGWLVLFGLLGPVIRRHYDELILVDCPGFGGFLSGEKSFPSVDALAQAVGDVFDELRPQTLVGHSLGGYLCALYSVLCGEGKRGNSGPSEGQGGPRKLVLLDPSGVFGTSEEYAAFVGRFKTAAKEGFHHLRPHVFGTEPSWFRFVMHEFARFISREDIGQFLESIREDHALTARLPSVRAETWVIWGENDSLIPVSHLRIWLGALTGTQPRGFLIRGAGHSPHIERPAATAALLAQVFAQREPHALGARWYTAVSS
jgi:pimeloyl-ACP methyl ester carboxylesterase